MNNKKEHAPLSQSQAGIYAECVQFPESGVYDQPFLFRISKTVDLLRLRDAIRIVLEAHPYANCRIETDESGTPAQYIDNASPIEIPITDVPDIEQVKGSLWKPFKFDGSPLCRLSLWSDASANYLFMQWHHIIFDGTTLSTFFIEVEQAYQGHPVGAEQVSSLDYVQEEVCQRQSEQLEADRQWYQEHILDTETETLLLPDLEDERKIYQRVELPLRANTQHIIDFCRQQGVKLSNYFCSAFALLLSRYTGDEQVLFPTIWHGRKQSKLSRTFGMYVATVPLYYQLKPSDTVADLLEQGRIMAEGTREHSLYSLADAVSEMGIHTHVMFAYQGRTMQGLILGGEPVSYEHLMSNATNLPLSLQVFMGGKGLSLRVEYLSSHYSKTFISQLIQSYDTVLDQLTDIDKLLSTIETTSAAQLQLLDTFNETDFEYDDTQTIVSLFRQQAARHPEKTAVVYKDKRYTYKEADELTDRLASHLFTRGLKPEDVVAILIPRSEWMALAPLGVLKAGCAYQPLDPTYPEERLNFMMQDANVKLLIAEEGLLPLVGQYQGDVVLTKDIFQLPPALQLPESPTPHTLFNLLYTSGSTGVPKGCQLEHRNVVAFCLMNQHTQQISAESRVSAYASFGFDASVMEVFSTLTAGAELHIVPEEIRLDLVAMNAYFEQNQITHGFMTTQVGYQFAANFESHSLRYLLTGGEKLPSLTPPSSYVLINAYGPSESICYVTAYKVTDQRKNIPIGKAVCNTHLYIVDKYGHRLPVGACGELWITGPQVTRGYLNRPEKTAEAFIANPFCKEKKHNRVYRTGDIVRYLPDGNIQFVGRQDGQVKIRGFRIELKEVEAIIRQYPGIKDVTVQAFDETGGGKFIAAFVVSDEQVDIQALNNFILEEKPPYMVPAITMQIERIPLNQNQKVDKKALPKPEKQIADLQAQENVPMNILEQEIHEIIVNIINNSDFGVTTLLGYAGLTSIMAIRLAIQINKRFGVTLDSKTLVKAGTVQSIENEILGKLLHADKEVEPVAEQQHSQLKEIPLSYAQMGVYVDCMKQPGSTIYNIPSLIPFPLQTDAVALINALQKVVKAHPLLSVHFDSVGTEIVQVLNPDQPVNITQSVMSEEELLHYKHEFVKPFNLKQAPLYRFELVKTELRLCLLADIHHLVIDGGSMDVFMHQLCDLMNGEEIEPEDASYADFVVAEKEAEHSERYQAAREFFQHRLGECEGVTELQTDLTNPIDQGTTGLVVSKLDFPNIEGFCREHNITPAHLTLSAVFFALARFTNNERLCITTISNGRSDLRIRNTVGMFVNTLALSAEVGNQQVMDFVNETSKNFDETLSHENYPFAQIASDYDLSAEIMFAYQVGVLDKYVCQGHALELESLEVDVPKFRIAFFIREHEGVPSVCVEYDNGRYTQSLMLHLAQAVSHAVNAFIRQPEVSLHQVSLVDAAQIELLDSFNQTDVSYDATQTIVSLFRKQVTQTPDNEAVVYHERRYTYHEVDEISERIAHYIISKGLSNEDVVSVLIPRCEWMVIASIGVLKAGCAYQPLDPSYPTERLNFMMKDAGAKLLISSEELRILVDEYDGDVLFTCDIMSLPKESAQVKADIRPENLFILLYTSGSTGVPKGCQLEHGNLTAFCHWYQRHYELTSEGRVAAYASYGFDACMMDMYPALTCGACVYIIGDDIRLNLPDLNAYFEANSITHSFITTQVGYQFATNVENYSLKHFAVGGEKLSALNPPQHYKMHNGYGPTECTIFTTNYWVRDNEQDIPIGKPLDNLRLYIVDKYGHRLPAGAAGELWVSGPQVSRGYLNRPDKTAEVYLKNPFDSDPQHSRIYRTGDIVRYLPDGNIQFVGRKDGQVKIRGFRIELKEVEAVIRQYPGIKDATVQAFDYENGGKYIAAYVVSDETIDVKALNAFIGKQKPSYMIPATTMQIDAIPLNQNQKVNRKALPAPVIQASDRAYVAPANDIEKLFCRIFGDILTMDKVGALDNFFELGGTSLMVTRVIIEADKNGHHIAYGDLFSHPTPRQLAAFVRGEAQTSNSSDDANFDYAPIDALLQQNTLENFKKGELRAIGNVLLTGATGYLGIHVLKELIDRDDVPVIWCMVRAKDENKAEHRLKSLLYYYYGKNFKDLFGTRLRIVLGDVTQDIHITEQVDTVYNCAAMVKHFSKGTEIEDVNIGGAEHCVKFCLEQRARLIHISTYSTAGLSVNGIPGREVKQTEQKLYYGQYMENQYVHSKFISERTVLDAVARQGLDGKVMRLGNLAPRSTDGEFQINFQTNSAMGRIRVFRMLGCYPYEMSDEPMEFSPINEVAHSIVLLSQTPHECTLFHPYNNHHVYFGDVLNELSILGPRPVQVEAPKFAEELAHAGEDPEKAKRLSSLLAYQDMAHGKEAFEIPTTNSYTAQVLYRLGFRWSVTSWDYVDRFLTAIDGLGFFD